MNRITAESTLSWIKPSSAPCRLLSAPIPNRCGSSRWEFSPRILWLARAVATEGSVEQIDNKLATDALLTSGMGDMRHLVRIVGTRSKRVPIEQFRGGGATLPTGGWASNIKLGAITKALAHEVLAKPGDLVQQAAGGRRSAHVQTAFTARVYRRDEQLVRIDVFPGQPYDRRDVLSTKIIN
jgi:hypothetical protein